MTPVAIVHVWECLCRLERRCAVRDLVPALVGRIDVWALQAIRKCGLKRLAFYRRLFGWRGAWLGLRARLSSRPFEARTIPSGSRHAVTLRLKTTDILTFEKVFLDGEYDLPLARHPRHILDAGANIGLASIYFANQYPNARILAVEPEESNFALLKHNVAPYPNVVPIRAALWGFSGAIDLVDPGIGHWGFRAGNSSGGSALPHVASVPARTVDDLMTEHGFDAIDLLKLDIEGGELEVLENPSAWIHKVGVLVAELHDRYRVGCSRRFYRATEGFDVEVHKGENVFMVRRDFASPELLASGAGGVTTS